MATFFGTVKEDGLGHHMNGLPALAMMIFALIPWPISEGVSGQTIGKRLFDLKVVKPTYKAIGFGQAFGRFFLGLIDYIFAIGLIVAIFNKRNKRIGDLAADAIVVRINQ